MIARDKQDDVAQPAAIRDRILVIGNKERYIERTLKKKELKKRLPDVTTRDVFKTSRLVVCLTVTIKSLYPNRANALLYIAEAQLHSIYIGVVFDIICIGMCVCVCKFAHVRFILQTLDLITH